MTSTSSPQHCIINFCVFSETLKTLSPLSPAALKELAAESGRTNRHKEEIEDLVAHLDKIAVSS